MLLWQLKAGGSERDSSSNEERCRRRGGGGGKASKTAGECFVIESEHFRNDGGK